MFVSFFHKGITVNKNNICIIYYHACIAIWWKNQTQYINKISCHICDEEFKWTFLSIEVFEIRKNSPTVVLPTNRVECKQKHPQVTSILNRQLSPGIVPSVSRKCVSPNLVTIRFSFPDNFPGELATKVFLVLLETCNELLKVCLTLCCSVHLPNICKANNSL